MKENEPVKISDITSSITDYSTHTLKKDIKYLLDERIIKKIGKARATIYLINDTDENEI